jgi:two-component system C4-dicarboxylate transport sensor histidine kinase DctB
VSWRQHRARMEAERHAMADLESRVIERTSDLEDALAKLGCEIAERQKIDQELHRTRDELVVAAKLAAVGRAFSGLAHEVNQPLAAIKTHLHSVRLLIERQDSLAAIDNIVVMLAAVDRLADLTGDLKRLAYQGPDERRPTDLCAVVARVAGLLRFRLADAGISFDAVMDGAVMVMGSPGRLEQVVLNLLLNAVDAVAEQSTRHIRIEVVRRGDLAELAVADNGPGVSDEDRPRLFEPFFTTKPEGEGLGLGLAVSQTIVRDQGGTLAFVRTVRCESCFVVSLPALNAKG